MGHPYYWCVEACEFATDITFKERSDLETFYKKLVETSYFTFSCNDIYSFLEGTSSISINLKEKFLQT